jgi:hypothetical protein
MEDDAATAIARLRRLANQARRAAEARQDAEERHEMFRTALLLEHVASLMALKASSEGPSPQ